MFLFYILSQNLRNDKKSNATKVLHISVLFKEWVEIDYSS